MQLELWTQFITEDSMAKARGWIFTINNPTEQDVPTLAWKDAKYVVFQKESGAEGTQHYQGYVLFGSQQRLSAVKKLNGRAHWEPRRGTHEQAKAYCMKEDTRVEPPIELGEEPRPGARSDIERLVELSKDLNNSVKDIIEECPAEFAKYHKAVMAIRAAYVPIREWKTEVHWFWGPTGTGKSKKAFEMTTNPYVHNMSSGKWFCGYNGQEDVIFDDMRKDTFKYHELLRLFDRYQMQVEVKGGSTNWCPKRIIVTTCLPPDKMYDTREDIGQLMRRIEIIEHFPASLNDVLGKRKRDDPPQYAPNFIP